MKHAQNNDNKRPRAKRVVLTLKARVTDLASVVLSSATLSNVSETGACFTVPEDHIDKIPEQFILYLTPDGKTRRYCQRMWSRGPVFGARFIKPKPVETKPGFGPDNVVLIG